MNSANYKPIKTIIVMSSFMRRSLLSVFWIAIMISGLVFVGNMNFCSAQSEMSTSIPVATNASGRNGSLELTLTLDKTSYSLGEPVNLTLTITNISNQTINYTHTGLDFDFSSYQRHKQCSLPVVKFQSDSSIYSNYSIICRREHFSQLHLATNMQFQRTS